MVRNVTRGGEQQTQRQRQGGDGVLSRQEVDGPNSFPMESLSEVKQQKTTGVSRQGLSKGFRSNDEEPGTDLIVFYVSKSVRRPLLSHFLF